MPQLSAQPPAPQPVYAPAKQYVVKPQMPPGPVAISPTPLCFGQSAGSPARNAVGLSTPSSGDVPNLNNLQNTTGLGAGAAGTGPAYYFPVQSSSSGLGSVAPTTALGPPPAQFNTPMSGLPLHLLQPGSSLGQINPNVNLLQPATPQAQQGLNISSILREQQQAGVNTMQQQQQQLNQQQAGMNTMQRLNQQLFNQMTQTQSNSSAGYPVSNNGVGQGINPRYSQAQHATTGNYSYSHHGANINPANLAGLRGIGTPTNPSIVYSAMNTPINSFNPRSTAASKQSVVSQTSGNGANNRKRRSQDAGAAGSDSGAQRVSGSGASYLHSFSAAADEKNAEEKVYVQPLALDTTPEFLISMRRAYAAAVRDCERLGVLEDRAGHGVLENHFLKSIGYVTLDYLEKVTTSDAFTDHVQREIYANYGTGETLASYVTRANPPERNSGTGAVDASKPVHDMAGKPPQSLLLDMAGDAVANRWVVRYCQDNPVFLQRVSRALDAEGVKKLGKHINGYRLIVALLESEFGAAEMAGKLNQLIADQTLIGFAKATYGCRVIQAAVEYLEPMQFNAVDALALGEAEKACAVIEDQNGNHVMQKIIAKQKYDLNTFVNAILPVTQKIAMNVFGCRVIMRLLEFGTIQQILSVGASLLTANMIGTL